MDKKRFMVKKLTLILTLIMIVSLIIGGCILYATGGIIQNYNEENLKKIEISKSFPAKELNAISVNCTNADLTLTPTDGNEATIHYYGNADSKTSPRLDAFIDDKILRVEIKQKVSFWVFNFNINPGNTKLDISIPRKYSKEIKLRTVSGEVNVNNIAPNTLELSTVSGKTNLDNIKASSSKISSVSGKIIASNLDSVETSIESVSGEIECKNIHTASSKIKTTSGYISSKGFLSKDTTIKTVSGNIDMSEFEGNFSGKTTSGDLSLKYSKFNNNIDFGTVSGNTNLNLPASSQFAIDYKTVSGDYNSEFEMPITNNNRRGFKGSIGTSPNNIVIDSTSGDFHLNKLP